MMNLQWKHQEALAFGLDTYIVNPRMRMQSGSFMIWGHAPLNGEDRQKVMIYEEYHKKGVRR